jgi:hypothetical protein
VSGGPLWLQKCIYVCACQLSGGSNKYNKIFPIASGRLVPRKLVAITLGHPISNPIRLNCSSWRLSLIGLFLIRLLGQMLLLPRTNLLLPRIKLFYAQKLFLVLKHNLGWSIQVTVSQDKSVCPGPSQTIQNHPRPSHTIPDYPTCNINVTRCLGSFLNAWK